MPRSGVSKTTGTWRRPWASGLTCSPMYLVSIGNSVSPANRVEAVQDPGDHRMEPLFPNEQGTGHPAAETVGYLGHVPPGIHKCRLKTPFYGFLGQRWQTNVYEAFTKLYDR